MRRCSAVGRTRRSVERFGPHTRPPPRLSNNWHPRRAENRTAAPLLIGGARLFFETPLLCEVLYEHHARQWRATPSVRTGIRQRALQRGRGRYAELVRVLRHSARPG